jgi:YHS domain-containing protein
MSQYLMYPTQLPWLCAFLGASCFSLGTPPLPEDSKLTRIAPEECLFCISLTGTATPDPMTLEQTPALGLDGYCPVELVKNQRWTLGCPELRTDYCGRRYLFSTPEAKDEFRKNPRVYAPVAGGNDVVAMRDHKQAIPGDRSHGVFYAGHIYLFANEENLFRFAASPERYAMPNQSEERPHDGARTQ